MPGKLIVAGSIAPLIEFYRIQYNRNRIVLIICKQSLNKKFWEGYSPTLLSISDRISKKENFSIYA
jgi:hypothetical protein